MSKNKNINISSDRWVLRLPEPESDHRKNVDAQPRTKPKLDIALCLKINEFLAPQTCPEMLHSVPEGGPVTYPFFGGENAARFIDVTVGGREESHVRPKERAQLHELGNTSTAAPPAEVDAPLKETARWVLSKTPLVVRDGGDCGPDTAAWLLRNYGPPVHREGPFTTRQGIRHALQQAWKRVIADDPSLDEGKTFVSERFDQVPEARDRSCLEAQIAEVLDALLREESEHSAAQDQGRLAAPAPLPYWFITSDWAQLSKHLQVDFVIHGIPDTEKRPCRHCGTNGHIHMGLRDPGTDVDLHLHWRGAGQGSAMGAAWGHWEPMVHATDEAEFGAPHTQEDACAGSPDQNGPDQQFDELSTAAQETLAAIETGMDALIAAQLQQEEEEKARGRASAPKTPDQTTFQRARSDNEMKELLRTLQPPHYVRPSETHGQNNCLMDSILLALQDQEYIEVLTISKRAAICSSIRRYLIDHTDVAPEDPDGRQSYLSHEESFDAICGQLRTEHKDIWMDGLDPTRLPIVVVVVDRLQRRQLYDESGAWTAEQEELNKPVLSKAPSAEEHLPGAQIHLYCNTHEDDVGTPYHYEWISTKAGISKEGEEESGMEDDETNDPIPFHTPTSDEDYIDDEDDNPAAPRLMSDTDDNDSRANAAPSMPILPLGALKSSRSPCDRVLFFFQLQMQNISIPIMDV